MYQFALVKMLHNTEKNTFHPIYYYDSPWGGPIEGQKLMRYKSKGQHTAGFTDRAAAVIHANELVKQLEVQHDTVLIELSPEQDLLWDGKEMPTDYQMRQLPSSLNTKQ